MKCLGCQRSIIECKNINDLATKLQTYNDARVANFLVNWDKVSILTYGEFRNVDNIINNFNIPYCDIKCVTTAKILGCVISNKNDRIADVSDILIE